jgi:hypothetical protein
MQNYTSVCPNCQKSFSTRDKRQICCSKNCSTAYMMASKAVPFEQRFWSKVDKSGGPDACWPWTASRHVKGYGQFRVSRTQTKKAHRLAYTYTKGEIPEDMQVMHSCDYPPCCNPAHLSVGTSNDNTQDMINKGRKYMGSVNRGVEHGMAKINEDIVRYIRKSYSEGARIIQIAAELSLQEGVVFQVVHRKTWKHVL